MLDDKGSVVDGVANFFSELWQEATPIVKSWGAEKLRNELSPREQQYQVTQQAPQVTQATPEAQAQTQAQVKPWMIGVAVLGLVAVAVL